MSLYGFGNKNCVCSHSDLSHPEAMSYPGNKNMFGGINLNWNFILTWGTVDLFEI